MYLEMMKKCYMINTPWLFNTLWYFVKGLLAARTIQKVCQLIAVVRLKCACHLDFVVNTGVNNWNEL